MSKEDKIRQITVRGHVAQPMAGSTGSEGGERCAMPTSSCAGCNLLTLTLYSQRTKGEILLLKLVHDICDKKIKTRFEQLLLQGKQVFLVKTGMMLLILNHIT